MPRQLDTIAPDAVTNPSGQISTRLDFGKGTLIFYNESKYYLLFNNPSGADEYILLPWTADAFYICEAMPFISWKIVDTLDSSGVAPNQKVFGLSHTQSEALHGSYPIALSRQTNIGNTVMTQFQFPHGNAFPSNPAPQDVFLRDDSKILYQWDGTNWYSVQENTLAWSASYTLMPTSGAGSVLSGLLPSAPTIYVTSAYIGLIVIGTCDLANYWTASLATEDTTGAIVRTLWSRAINASGTWQRTAHDINLQLAGNEQMIDLNLAKTGTPSPIYVVATVKYRYIQ